MPRARVAAGGVPGAVRSARHGGGPVAPLPAQLVGLYVAPRAELQVATLRALDADVGLVAEFAVQIVRGEYRDVDTWET